MLTYWFGCSVLVLSFVGQLGAYRVRVADRSSQASAEQNYAEDTEVIPPSVERGGVHILPPSPEKEGVAPITEEQKIIDALSELGLTQAVAMFGDGPNRLEAAVHNGATSVSWVMSLLEMPAVVQTEALVKDIYGRGAMMTQAELDESTQALKDEMSRFDDLLASVDEALDNRGLADMLSNETSPFHFHESKALLSELLKRSDYKNTRETVESLRAVVATVDETVSKCTDDQSLNFYRNIVGGVRDYFRGQTFDALGKMAHNVMLRQKKNILVKYLEAVVCPSVHSAIREIAAELMMQQFSHLNFTNPESMAINAGIDVDNLSDNVPKDTVQKFVYLVSVLLDEDMPLACKNLYHCGKRECPEASFVDILKRISGNATHTCMCGNAQCRVKDDRTRSGFGCEECGTGCLSPEALAQCKPKGYSESANGCIKEEVGQQMVLGSAGFTRVLLRQNLYVDPMAKHLADYVERWIGRGLARTICLTLKALLNIRKDATALYNLFSVGMTSIAATKVAMALGSGSALGAVIAIGGEFINNPVVLSSFYYIKARLSTAGERFNEDGFCAKAAAKLSGLNSLSQDLQQAELVEFAAAFTPKSDILSAQQGSIHKMYLESQEVGDMNEEDKVWIDSQDSGFDKGDDADLTAYWDEGSCGPRGDDHNWAWCGKKHFNGCNSVVETSLRLCPTGLAKLAYTKGTGKWNSYSNNGCGYAYFAQYRCYDATEAQPEPSNPIMSMAETLRELKALLDEGILTQDEFDSEKAKVLEA